MAHHVLRILIAAMALLIGWLVLTGHWQQQSPLQKVHDDGVLVMVTRLGPTTLYETGNGLAGMDYDLGRAFADELGVALRVIVALNNTQMYQTLASRRAHFAAGGLSASEGRKERFRFSTSYADVNQHLVYRRGGSAPKSIDEFRELSNAHIKVLADSTAEDRMRAIDPAGEEINWFATRTTGVQDLLYGVWTREIDLTVVDSNELALNQSYYPELQVGFTFDEPRALAWGFLDSGDDSLHEAAEEFLDRIRNDGTLDSVRERYYGYLSGFDYVGARIFLRHVTERLPDYREDFQRAAQEHDLDWRLLAALSYQESHWDPDAVSRTGVRGMMMLTQRTAGQLGVENRLDPTASIEGGARYLRSLKDRLPERIENPTRTWMALAAYNVGMGHLQDARALTEQQGKDPDNWAHLREHLPLLSRPEWYRQTRYGYARGWEPVHYVRGVRSYYERLLRITEPSRFRLPTDADREKRRAFSPGDAGHVQLPKALEAAQ